ncbi:MAG: aspartate 1-decarboxylase [Clostridia bacterium]|nr:aspartate 1-decarboxylase [Clostridia bacterium]MDD4571181.1 aspartate 1-decarboxylase [Clostridia bacterium]
MNVNMLKAKLHRARVTEANLNYIGSITIDSALMKASGILSYEKVTVVNNNNGARLTTYAIEGEENSGVICLNGAAARLVQKDDVVIIMAFASMAAEEAENFRPTVVFLDEKNRITDIKRLEEANTLG